MSTCSLVAGKAGQNENETHRLQCLGPRQGGKEEEEEQQEQQAQQWWQ